MIEEHGIDERFGQLDGLFGAGNYFAENASKVRSRSCWLVCMWKTETCGPVFTQCVVVRVGRPVLHRRRGEQAFPHVIGARVFGL